MSYHYNLTDEQRKEIEAHLENNIRDLIRHHKKDGVFPTEDKSHVCISQLTYVDIVGIIGDYLKLHEDFDPDKETANEKAG